MERIEGLSIGLDLDSTALNRGLTGLKDKLRTVNSEMKANLSAFDRSERSVAKYETILTGLNRKIEVQEAVTKSARQEYEKMVREHGEGSAEAEKAARSYNNEVAALNTLRRRIESTQRQLADFREEQRISQSRWTRLGNAIDGAGTRLVNFGEHSKKVGGFLTTRLTAPIIALGAGITSLAVEFEDSSVRITNSLGATADETKYLTKVASGIYRDGYGESLSEVDDALIQTKQNITNLNEEDLSKVTKKAMLLANTFDSEVNEVTRAGNTLITNYGLDADKAFDLMAKGAQKGMNFSKEMFDNMAEYTINFKEAGFSANEMFAILSNGAKKGYNLDRLNDTLLEFKLQSEDSGKAYKGAMSEMSKDTRKVFRDYEKGKATVSDLYKAVIPDLEKMRKSLPDKEFNTIGKALFGTKWEDQGADVVLSMKTVNKELKNVDGTMDDMAKNVEKSFGNRSKKVWRDTKNALKPLGEVLLSFAEDTLPKVSKEIERVTDFINNLSPEAKKSIVIFSGIAAAVGPVAFGLGTVSSGIGTVMKFLSPLLPALGAGTGLTGILAGLTGPIGLTALALGGLGLGFIALDKQMDKPIIKSDIFKGKISETTQKVITEYDKLKTDSNSLLMQMATGNEKVTDEHISNIIAKYKEMSKMILEQLDTRHQEERAKLIEQLNQNKTMSDEEKAKTLANFDEHYTKERQLVLDNETKKLNIVKDMQGKSEEERQASREKIAQIDLTNDQIMLENTAQTKEEYLTIQRNLKNESAIISAEKAAKYVSDSKDTTDKVIQEANKRAEEEISSIEYERDVTGSISKEAADKLIADAEYRRDNTVATAQDEHTAVVRAAKDQAGEHVDQVNWETGQVLTGWDSMYNGVISAVNWILDLFGKKPFEKKGDIKENGRQTLKRQDAKLVAGYAKGTSPNGHPGGPAIVGEEGRELGFVPGKGITLLGARGPEFHSNLPRGTSVLPNKQTEEMLRSYGFPGYAEGIGDYFNMFLDGAGSVWDFMTGKFNLKDEIIPDWLNKHTGSPLKMIGKLATDWIKDTWDNFFGSVGSSSGGSGVQQWAGVASKALMLTNQYSQSNLDRLLYQMQTESGGNPKAINLWDINAKRGIPSKGLMQVIDPTFKAYAMSGYNSDIYDPLSNIIASIRYAVSRYGSLEKAYRGVGYATGGLINNEGLYRLAEGGWSEYVIPTDPSKRTEAMKLLALAGKQIQGNKRPNQLPNVNNSNDNSVMSQLLDATLKQNQILMQLLQKNDNVYLGEREVTDTVRKRMATDYGMLNYQLGGG